MAKRARFIIMVVYYTTLAVLIALILSKLLVDMVPPGVASRVGHNSEGLLLVLGVSLWLDFARTRLKRRPSEWVITLSVAATCVGLGFYLKDGPNPPQLITLNETAFALALLIPYMQLRRPVAAWAFILPVLSVLVPAVGGSNGVTTDLAEVFGACVVIPICIDIVDPGIITGSPVPWLRVGLWGAFLVASIVFLQVATDQSPDNPFEDTVRYLSRVIEMLVAGLILHCYQSLCRSSSTS